MFSWRCFCVVFSEQWKCELQRAHGLTHALRDGHAYKSIKDALVISPLLPSFPRVPSDAMLQPVLSEPPIYQNLHAGFSTLPQQSDNRRGFFWLQQQPMEPSSANSHLLTVNIGKGHSHMDCSYVDLPPLPPTKPRRTRFTERLMEAHPREAHRNSPVPSVSKKLDSRSQSQSSAQCEKSHRHRPGVLRSVIILFTCCVTSDSAKTPKRNGDSRRNKT
ncbi:unnamed protein product [Haemonchus placei]|uniref:Transcription cofactor vestigial-like protein 2 n=1 Tax=Haemonchus placei TaxID=6290 RepID=A0A0N4W8A7_HAEPC|nr:unnamed protein product [Haemonchus placei]